jgi:hypothetical protein
MWINFADMVKNFYNLNLIGILGIGLGKWEKVEWRVKLGIN